jgi:hypothetical protein
LPERIEGFESIGWWNATDIFGLFFCSF